MATQTEIMIQAGYSPAHGMIASSAEFSAARTLADEAATPARLVLAIDALDQASLADLADWSRADAALGRIEQTYRTAPEREVARAEREVAWMKERADDSMGNSPCARLRVLLLRRLAEAGVSSPRVDTACLSAFHDLALDIRSARGLRRVVESHRQGRCGMAGIVPSLLAETMARLASHGITRI